MTNTTKWLLFGVTTTFVVWFGGCAACAGILYSLVPDLGFDHQTPVQAPSAGAEHPRRPEKADPRGPPSPDEAVALWTKKHLGVTVISGLHDVADWACGERRAGFIRQVKHLFYVRGERVVSVYRFPEDRDTRETVWQDPNAKPCTGYNDEPVSVRKSGELPAYTIVSTIQKMGGGVLGDILVTSLSPKTPAAERERVLRAVMEEHGFEEAHLYCTRAARRANISASFAKQNPDAIECVIGRAVRGGKFHP